MHKRLSPDCRCKKGQFQDLATHVGGEFLVQSNDCLVLKQNLRAVFVWQAMLNIMMNPPLLPSLSNLREKYGLHAYGISTKIEALLSILTQLISIHQASSLRNDFWAIGIIGIVLLSEIHSHHSTLSKLCITSATLLIFVLYMHMSLRSAKTGLG